MVSDGALARISAKDDGIGTAPDTLEKAFALFSQAARLSDRTSRLCGGRQQFLGHSL
jgi:signal transduction histidine kinase